jgi:phosphoribosylanthranilate isomerase
VFDWALAAEAPDGVRLILAGGLDPDNVAERSGSSSRGVSTCRRGVESSPVARTR